MTTCGKIVSASYRCDVPAYFGKWFQARRRAGFCHLRNPYNGKLSHLSLKPAEVAAYLFWSRNYRPFLPVLQDLAAGGEPFVLQMTLTGYPRAIEPHCLAVEPVIETARTLRCAFGPKVLVWRYDPIFLSSLTPPDWHMENFAKLAHALAGTGDEVVFSFTQVYAKTRRRADRAAAAQGFSWRDPENAEKRTLLRELAAIALDHGFTPTLCAQDDLLTAPLVPAACADPARFGDIAGRKLNLPRQANRPGCLCAKVSDVGAYDLCAQGCVYCYAVSSQKRATGRISGQDLGAPCLG